MGRVSLSILFLFAWPQNITYLREIPVGKSFGTSSWRTPIHVRSRRHRRGGTRKDGFLLIHILSFMEERAKAFENVLQTLAKHAKVITNYN